MTTIKIAVASTDGAHVNQHFGRAERFSIYEMGQPLRHIEDRACETLSVGDPQHAFDEPRFSRIADTIADCQRVYVSDIGAVPEAQLKARGLEVIRCNCPIDEIGGCGGKCRCSSD